MRSLKPCMQAGCIKLVVSGYCDEHKPEIKHIDSRRGFKELDKKKTTKEIRFYNSPQWKKTRKLFRKKFPLCQRCLSRGIIQESQLVHHIKELKDIWRDKENPLKWSNLEALCNNCHLEDLRAKKIKKI